MLPRARKRKTFLYVSVLLATLLALLQLYVAFGIGAPNFWIPFTSTAKDSNDDVQMSCDNLHPDHGYVHFIMVMPEKNPLARNIMSLCSVESVLHHSHLPTERVVLWTLDQHTRSAVGELWDLKQQADGSKLLVCDGSNSNKMFEGTPFVGWNCTGPYCPNNLSNALRLALIYKYGGVYLDLDVIMIRSSAAMVGNIATVEWENKTWYNNAYLNFPSGHKLVWRIMEEFVDTFDGFKYGNNGPRLFDRVIIPCLQNSDRECQDIAVSPEQKYAPVHFNRAADWLNSTNTWSGHAPKTLKARGTWGVHWYASQWFGVTKGKEYENEKTKVCLGCGTLGHRLFHDNCPTIFQNHSDKFMCAHCSRAEEKW